MASKETDTGVVDPPREIIESESELQEESYAQPPPYPQWRAPALQNIYPAPQNTYPPPQPYQNPTGSKFRSRPEYRRERQQWKQTFTPLEESYASLFQRLRQLDVLRPIESKIPNPPPKNLDYSLRCAYCSDAPRHDTEKSWHLKRAIQELIDTNQIVVQSPDAPNINQNPLPAHAETHMIEIVHKDGESKKSSKSVMMIRASESNLLKAPDSTKATPLTVEGVTEKPSSLNSKPPVLVMKGLSKDIGASSKISKMVVPWIPSKPVIVVKGALITPIIIKPVTQLPVVDAKAVSWNYKQVIVTYKGKEIEEEVNETGGLTRSGRYFTPEELRKAKPFKDSQMPVKKSVIEEEAEEFLKKMKVLMKILNEAHVPDKIAVNHLEKTARKIFEANRITFSDDELPMEGTEHNRALYLTIGTERIHLNSVCVRGFDGGGKDSVGNIMLELSIGPFEFTIEFQVLDVDVSYNLLLGRPWIHVAKTFETVSVEKIPKGKCIPGLKLSSASVMVANEMLKNGFVPVKGLGSSLQGIVHPVRHSGNPGTFGLGFMPTEKDVKRVKNLKQKFFLSFPPFKQKLRKFKTDMSVKIKKEITKQLTAKILMDEEDIEKTVFITPWGTYCYRVMPFGLKNVGATYMRAMTTIFHYMIHKEIEVYVDDVIVKSKKLSDHVKDLRKFFQRLRRYNLKLNPAKCAFGVSSGKLLGFVVSRRSIELDPSKIKAIQELLPPKNKTEPMPTGRLAKWKILLTEFDIIYVTRTAMKAQALANHLAKNPVDNEYEPLKTYFPDEEVMCVDEVDRDEKPGWKLFFDGAANMKGVGIGVVLISETGQHYHVIAQLQFHCTNNITEYEACILGLRLAVDMGIQEILVLGDSDLLVHQIQGEWETRALKLIPYQQCLHDLCQRFRSIEFRHNPRIYNEIADALATLASMLHHPDKAYIDHVHIQVHDQHAYYNVVEEEIDGEPWFHDVKEYIRLGVYPVHATGDQKRTIRRLASGFFLSGGILYKRTPDLGLLRCIDAKTTSTIMAEVHSRVCGPHMNGYVLTKKILRAGYRTTVRTLVGATPYLLVYGTEAVIPAEDEIPSLRTITKAEIDDDE
ncbi:uncharacterized protein [Nicotiana sylvestris]|uniref:uncharacterized protein n=1 Tax=Nicotiana sylvestris TaxID=4096 RepID=UPI00388C6BE3